MPCSKQEWVEGAPLAMDREQVVRSLHWLLAQLHEALATNKAPDPEVAAIAERIAAWWDARQSAEPRPSLSFIEDQA